jgi:hypothetical protein
MRPLLRPGSLGLSQGRCALPRCIADGARPAVPTLILVGELACPSPILPDLRFTDFCADLQQVLVRLNYQLDDLRDYAPLR